MGELDLGDTRIGALALDGGGAVVLDGGSLAEVNGTLGIEAAQLAFADPGITEAVGSQIAASAGFNFTPGSVLDISDVQLTGADYGLTGDFLVSGLSSGITLSVDAGARYSDLSRLSRPPAAP